MAGELNIRQDASGLSGIEAEIYFGGAKIGANVALAEIAATKMYSADFPVSITDKGVYAIVFVDSSGDVIGEGQMYWDGDKEGWEDMSDIIDLLIKYHDNDVKFFDADGTTEIAQPDAFFMTVYDDDGTTQLKRIEFKDNVGAATTLTLATRYEKT